MRLRPKRETEAMNEPLSSEKSAPRGKATGLPHQRCRVSLALLITIVLTIGLSLTWLQSPGSMVRADNASANTNKASRGILSTYFLDIGQGDASLIRTPSGRFILIDTGPPGGRAALLRALKALRVQEIELMVFSHPHLDHYGNAIQVMERYPVKAVLDSGMITGSRTQEAILRKMKEKKVRLELVSRGLAGTSRDLGDGINLHIVYPKRLLDTDNANNNSVVLKLVYDRVSFLFAGDLEVQGREALLALHPDLRATVYKVSHHGSYNGTDRALMEQVRPKEAIISSGGKYGHPHRQALKELRRAGARIWRTDRQGTINLTTNGSRYDVATRGK